MSDQPSEIVRACDAWIATLEGHGCMLGADRRLITERQLRNRLEMAFLAGAAAQSRLIDKASRKNEMSARTIESL